jgi:hypothetical protein
MEQEIFQKIGEKPVILGVAAFSCVYDTRSIFRVRRAPAVKLAGVVFQRLKF